MKYPKRNICQEICIDPVKLHLAFPLTRYAYSLLHGRSQYLRRRRKSTTQIYAAKIVISSLKNSLKLLYPFLCCHAMYRCIQLEIQE